MKIAEFTDVLCNNLCHSPHKSHRPCCAVSVKLARQNRTHALKHLLDITPHSIGLSRITDQEKLSNRLRKSIRFERVTNYKLNSFRCCKLLYFETNELVVIGVPTDHNRPITKVDLVHSPRD